MAIFSRVVPVPWLVAPFPGKESGEHQDYICNHLGRAFYHTMVVSGDEGRGGSIML